MENNTRVIQIYSLDETLLGIADLPDYKFLKIDAEGYDTKILKGAINFLKQNKPVVFLEYNRDNMSRIGESGIDAIELLKDLGFDKILVYESMGRFILSTTLSDSKLIRQLHEYIDGKKSAIYYFDLCIFHKEDDDIATEFIEREENFRLHGWNNQGFIQV